VSGAESSSQFELFLRNVNRGQFCAKRLSDLNRKVSEATYAEDRQALAGKGCRPFQSPINRKSGTEERRSLRTRKTVREFHSVTGRRFYKLCIAAIHGDASDLLPGT
jgi:hypothetical protein